MALGAHESYREQRLLETSYLQASMDIKIPGQASLNLWW